PAPELLPYLSTCVLRHALERAFQGRERQAGTPALPSKEPAGSARVVYGRPAAADAKVWRLTGRRWHARDRTGPGQLGESGQGRRPSPPAPGRLLSGGAPTGAPAVSLPLPALSPAGTRVPEQLERGHDPALRPLARQAGLHRPALYGHRTGELRPT